MEALGVSCQIGSWAFHLGDVLSLSRASVVSLEGSTVLKAAGLSSLLEQRYSPPNKHQFGAGLGQLHLDMRDWALTSLGDRFITSHIVI